MDKNEIENNGDTALFADLESAFSEFTKQDLKTMKTISKGKEGKLALVKYVKPKVDILSFTANKRQHMDNVDQFAIFLVHHQTEVQLLIRFIHDHSFRPDEREMRILEEFGDKLKLLTKELRVDVRGSEYSLVTNTDRKRQPSRLVYLETKMGYEIQRSGTWKGLVDIGNDKSNKSQYKSSGDPVIWLLCSLIRNSKMLTSKIDGHRSHPSVSPSTDISRSGSETPNSTNSRIGGTPKPQPRKSRSSDNPDETNSISEKQIEALEKLCNLRERDAEEKEKELAETRKVNESFERRLAEADHKTHEYEREIASLEQINTALEKRLKGDAAKNKTTKELYIKEKDDEIHRLNETIDQIAKENEKLRAELGEERNKLKQLTEKEKEYIDQSKIIIDYQSRLEELDIEVAKLKIENTRLVNENAKMEATFEHFTEQKEKAYDKSLQELQGRLSETTDRLASEMNAKVSADESSLENISIKCRPMNVADEYANFVSGVWLDAKQELDKLNKVQEEIRVYFLREILMISTKAAMEMLERNSRSLAFSIQYPLRDSNDEPTLQIPGDIMSKIGDIYRKEADRIDILPLKQIITQAIVRDKIIKKNVSALDKLVKRRHIDRYIEGSTRLAWKMVIQRPQMVFKQPDIDKPFKGEKVHPLAWNSDPHAKALVQYYQYPTLLHGKSVMVLGKVFVA